MKSKKASGKKVRKLRSLNGALWLYFCLLLVLLIVLVELVFSIVMSQNLENGAKKDVSQVCDNIVITVQGMDIVDAQGQEAGQGDGSIDTETVLNRAVLSYFSEGYRVWIYNGDGGMVAPAGDMLGDMFSPGDGDEQFEDIVARLEGYQSGISVVYSARDNLNAAVMVRTADETYYVVVSYSTVGLRSVVSSTMLYLLIVGIAVLIIGLIVAYFISQKVTRGVQELSSSARKLAKGDYTATFTNADYAELAELSDTLNEMRDEVKKTNDFQKEILANVTHDLKTPITMIKAYASMIQDFSGDDPVKRNKHLQVIIDESDRLTGLINDVLDVSKVSSNLDTMNPKVFNLTEFLYSIINKFSYLQETQGYTIMVDIDPDQYTRADTEKIGQVIYNLVGNAANYTGEDKTIYISLKSNMEGTRIRFSVRDTGKGIAKEEIPNIWDRYYRSKKDHVRPVKGTGLGLNICKIILNNHKFDFGVDSELGKGSTFWVDFPSVPAESIEQAKTEDIKEAAAALPAPDQAPAQEPAAPNPAPKKKRSYNRKPKESPSADTSAAVEPESQAEKPADPNTEDPSAASADSVPAETPAEQTETPAPKKKRSYTRKPRVSPETPANESAKTDQASEDPFADIPTDPAKQSETPAPKKRSYTRKQKQPAPETPAETEDAPADNGKEEDKQ
ncbi:MAG: ATP-binding protein [Clostridia bacterium]|nr:ATP-binding protein [Clostridia bacterium]